MKKPTKAIRSKDDLLADEAWLAILEPELCKDTAAVECLARLLFILRKEINSGFCWREKSQWDFIKWN
ncbi:MAG TPA: hypothetical protein VGO96_19980 [Pyrinomonadaceae bacterium]|nr:hypothetical protein [Pyrinomonadaceae bacterium]